MLVKDFASELLAEIDSLPKSDDPNLDVLIRIESQQAFDNLKVFLHKLAFNENAITLANLKACSKFLSERWYNIKHTDSCYPHHPKTRANRAYLILAEAVSKLVPEEVYTLLMPTVGAIVHPTSRKNLSSFRLHEFVLGDDGTPIEVAKCLEDAAKQKTDKLFHTGGHRRPLSLRERERVINHSQEAYEYYDALQFYLNSGVENDLIQSKKIIHEVLESDDCTVTATYGKEGRRRLTKSILSTVKNQKDLMALMVEIPRQDWPDFLKDMDTNDLSRLILEDDSFLNAIQKPKAYSLDEVNNKAFLFCATELYKRERLCAGEYDNPWGYFTAMSKKYIGDYSKYLQSYTKEEKIAAVDVLQDFLRSNRNLCELDAYLESNAEINAHRGPLFETMSDLGWITYQIKLVSDRHFFQPKPSGFLAKLFG